MVINSASPARPRLLSPQTVIGLICSVLLFAVVLGLGDIRRAFGLVLKFPLQNVLAIFVLLSCYEGVRYAQWLVLVRQAGVHVTWRELLFSFSGGEATRSLPGGNYFQNYLLKRTGGADPAYTAATTTVIIWFEVCASLCTLLIVGVPGWWWLRPVCAPLLAGIAYVALVVVRRGRDPERPEWLQDRRWGPWLLDRAAVFREGAREVLTPTCITVGLALALGYLLLAGTAFTIILRGLGLPDAPLQQGVVAYMAGLAAGLVLPIPVDLGIAEIGGMGVLLALGINREVALAAVLINRIAGLVVGLLLAGLVSIILHDEWHAVFAEEQAPEATDQKVG